MVGVHPTILWNTWWFIDVSPFPRVVSQVPFFFSGVYIRTCMCDWSFLFMSFSVFLFRKKGMISGLEISWYSKMDTGYQQKTDLIRPLSNNYFFNLKKCTPSTTGQVFLQERLQHRTFMLQRSTNDILVDSRLDLLFISRNSHHQDDITYF